MTERNNETVLENLGIKIELSRRRQTGCVWRKMIYKSHISDGSHIKDRPGYQALRMTSNTL